mmetsp:Transcript_26183/g.84749  ORF Transcript_26183/g.84749 Transcript_26183/m.84749 type:complete len:210 (+) Transcript_26183:64-693(+)
MTMFFMSSFETPAKSLASWMAQTDSTRPASYSSFVSPMQSTGYMPSAMVLRTWRLISASSSPKTTRRSEWPARTYVTPRLLTMLDDTAPVNAPLSSWYTSWAPRWMGESFTISETGPRKGMGGNTMASPLKDAPATSFAKSVASLSVVGFIFQFPPMMLVRDPDRGDRAVCRNDGAKKLNDDADRSSAATRNSSIFSDAGDLQQHRAAR